MRMGTTYVAMIGKSPAANAVTLKSWLAHEPESIDRVVLLATDWIQSNGHADRLAAWIRREVCDAVDVVPVPNSVHGLRETVQGAVNGSRPFASPPVCNIAPGLRSFIVTMAAAMPAGTRFLAANPRDGVCRVQVFEPRESSHSIPLRDLGLTTVLDLWGGCAEYRFDAHDRPSELLAAVASIDTPEELGLLSDERTVWNLELTLLDGRIVRFEGARETQGLLKTISVRQQPTAVKRGAAARVERSLLVDEAALSGLMIVPHVVTDWRDLAHRLREHRRLTCIDVGVHQQGALPAQRARVKAALEPAAPPPWHDDDGDLRNEVLDVSEGAGGGAMPRQFVFLGADPSATLVSLYTYRPTDVWIAHDVTSSGAAVQEVRQRIMAELPLLPVGRIHWIRTALNGRGVGSVLAREWADGAGGRVDITPGAKEQSLALGRIPGADLWSLVAHRGRAESLATNAQLPLSGPPIAVQARCVGGPLMPAGGGRLWAGEAMRKYADRYDALSRAFGDPAANWDPRTVKSRWMSDSEAPPHWRDWRGAEHQRVSRLFEEVVAWRLLQVAQADEVNVAVEWQFVRFNNSRDEIDVVARFGASYVAVECKAWRGLHDGHSGVDDVFRDHKGRTSRCLGRYASPVMVVWTRPPGERISRDTRIWSFDQLSNPTAAKRLVSALIKSRSTLANGEEEPAPTRPQRRQDTRRHQETPSKKALAPGGDERARDLA